MHKPQDELSPNKARNTTEMGPTLPDWLKQLYGQLVLCTRAHMATAVGCSYHAFW